MCIRRLLPHLLALVALGAIVSTRAQAQYIFNANRSFTLYAENDAIFGSSDSSYTNGVRLAWEFLAFSERLGRLHRALSLEWALDGLPGVKLEAPTKPCAPREGQAGRNCGALAFGIAQTMYTPSNIIDEDLRPGDRPYAGMLFASGILSTLRPHWQSTTELQLGFIGPWSSAQSTQSLAHWTWSSPSGKPRGWDHQLRNAPQVALVNTYMFRPAFLEVCKTKFGCNGSYAEQRILDITPRVETVLGTYMLRASGGGIVRLGYGFPDAVGISRIPTTAARSSPDGLFPWFDVFASYDGRYVGRNAFISGTYADDGARGWSSQREIAATHGVSEWAFGGSVGFARASLTAQVVNRTREYTPNGGRHRFGSVSFTLFTRGSASR